MRGVTLVLLALLGYVHAELWFGRSGLPRVLELRAQVNEQQALNEQARARNERLQAEVTDLQTGREIIEEKARAELGMLRPDELLVQYTHPTR
ncbi:MAG: cell division protein FtsB [Burkholderiaceae bacterium]|nr:cell division protein FtsB [Burkholderiaceae bacterium]